MEQGYLIDTCAVIKYLSVVYPAKGLKFLDTVVDSESIPSFISVIELLAWNPANANDLLIYSKFIDGSRIIMMDAAIINQAVSIRKKAKLKIPDSIIAATAIVNGLTLISDNDRDFKKVEGLKYLNPMAIR